MNEIKYILQHTHSFETHDLDDWLVSLDNLWLVDLSATPPV